MVWPSQGKGKVGVGVANCWRGTAYRTRMGQTKTSQVKA